MISMDKVRELMAAKPGSSETSVLASMILLDSATAQAKGETYTLSTIDGQVQNPRLVMDALVFLDRKGLIQAPDNTTDPAVKPSQSGKILAMISTFGVLTERGLESKPSMRPGLTDHLYN